LSPEVLRRERDYDAGCDNQYDHLRPKAIGKATWLPVFLHSHGISPLEIFLRWRFRSYRNFAMNSDCDASAQLTPPQWNCFAVGQFLANALGLPLSLLRASRRN
jgi:hypothetical protein